MYAMVAADAAIAMVVARKDVMSAVEMAAAGFVVEVEKCCVQSVMVRVRFLDRMENLVKVIGVNVVNVVVQVMPRVQNVRDLV